MLEGLLKAVFTPFKTMLDNNEEKYQAVVERNKLNGMKGGRPKKDISEEETQENPKNPVGFSKTQPNPKKHDNDNDNVNDNDIYNKLIKFKKPTIKEIEDYCLERNNSIDSRYFYDYYESKGWLIGKTKMKDFKAAIRLWEQNQKKFNKEKEQEEEDFDYDNTPYRPF